MSGTLLVFVGFSSVLLALLALAVGINTRLAALEDEVRVIRTGLGIAKVVDKRTLDVTVAAEKTPHDEDDGGKVPFKAFGLQTMRTRQVAMEALLRNGGPR